MCGDERDVVPGREGVTLVRSVGSVLRSVRLRLPVSLNSSRTCPASTRRLGEDTVTEISAVQYMMMLSPPTAVLLTTVHCYRHPDINYIIISDHFIDVLHLFYHGGILKGSDSYLEKIFWYFLNLPSRAF